MQEGTQLYVENAVTQAVFMGNMVAGPVNIEGPGAANVNQAANAPTASSKQPSDPVHARAD